MSSPGFTLPLSQDFVALPVSVSKVVRRHISWKAAEMSVLMKEEDEVFYFLLYRLATTDVPPVKFVGSVRCV